MNSDTGAGLPKLLIVDDSRMVRASIIKHIRGRFNCREEVDGEAGWEALLVDPSIDLVVTDLGMPKLDGYGLLERIRSSGLARIRSLPVVVISGDEDEAAREKARGLGANDFITKGISTPELLARLDTLNTLGRARRELEEAKAEQQRQQAEQEAAQQRAQDALQAMAAQAAAASAAQEIPPALAAPTSERPADLLEPAGSVANVPQGNISSMVVAVDDFERIGAQHGAHVAQLVTRKLSKILAGQVRQEDTVAQLAPNQFAILSPSIGVEHCCSLALRIQQAIEKMVMTYREERIRIRVSVGVANSLEDGISSVSNLIGLATRRADAGSRAGGGRVISQRGEVSQRIEVNLTSLAERSERPAAPPRLEVPRPTPSAQPSTPAHPPRSRKEIPDALMSELPVFEPEPVPEPPARFDPVSLDACLETLRLEGSTPLLPQLDSIIARVLPLLELIESEVGHEVSSGSLRRHIEKLLARRG